MRFFVMLWGILLPGLARAQPLLYLTNATENALYTYDARSHEKRYLGQGPEEMLDIAVDSRGQVFLLARAGIYRMEAQGPATRLYELQATDWREKANCMDIVGDTVLLIGGRLGTRLDAFSLRTKQLRPIGLLPVLTSGDLTWAGDHRFYVSGSDLHLYQVRTDAALSQADTVMDLGEVTGVSSLFAMSYGRGSGCDTTHTPLLLLFDGPELLLYEIATGQRQNLGRVDFTPSGMAVRGIPDLPFGRPRRLVASTVVTPNADGLNDQLSLSFTPAASDFSLTLYTRFGTEAFSTQEAAFRWPTEAPLPGVYFYTARYADPCLWGTPSQIERGWVELVR